KGLEGAAVVPDEGVVFERWLRSFGSRWIEFAALVRGTLQEEGRHRRGGRPPARGGRVVEHGAVAARPREELDRLEASQVHAEGRRVPKKGLRVGFSCDQRARLLLVHVLDELATHHRNGTLHVGAPDEHREVPHVHRVLLLQVDVQEVLGHLASLEGRPRPVSLPLHDGQQGLSKIVALHLHPPRTSNPLGYLERCSRCSSRGSAIVGCTGPASIVSLRCHRWYRCDILRRLRTKRWLGSSHSSATDPISGRSCSPPTRRWCE